MYMLFYFYVYNVVAIVEIIVQIYTYYWQSSCVWIFARTTMWYELATYDCRGDRCGWTWHDARVLSLWWGDTDGTPERKMIVCEHVFWCIMNINKNLRALICKYEYVNLFSYGIIDTHDSIVSYYSCMFSAFIGNHDRWRDKQLGLDAEVHSWCNYLLHV